MQKYAGSIVLGLNDALVELTGVLAGLTLALREPHLIAVAGLVTGIAASLSMAASGYFEAREDREENGHGKEPITAAAYTGFAYFFTVLILVAPYFIFSNAFYALGVTLILALIVIAGFTRYDCKLHKHKFLPRFLQMACISMGVAAISFVLAYVLHTTIGV